MSLLSLDNNLLKRGVRIALRTKVNEALITGVQILDSMLPVGKGQRQLILGDRSTGKTTIFINMLLSSYYFN
jgi:F-type H+-transporting ATPase subunit alpha